MMKVNKSSFRAAAALCVAVAVGAVFPDTASAHRHRPAYRRSAHGEKLVLRHSFIGNNPVDCAASVVAGEANPKSDGDQAGVTAVLKNDAQEHGLPICQTVEVARFEPKPARVTPKMKQIAGEVLRGDMHRVPSKVLGADEIRAPGRKWVVPGKKGVGSVGPRTNQYFVPK